MTPFMNGSQEETVYKPRRQVRGRGVAQISTLLNKSYFVKVSTKGGGGQKCPKFCLRGLYTTPMKGYLEFFYNKGYLLKSTKINV